VQKYSLYYRDIVIFVLGYFNYVADTFQIRCRRRDRKADGRTTQCNNIAFCTMSIAR